MEKNILRGLKGRRRKEGERSLKKKNQTGIFMNTNLTESCWNFEKDPHKDAMC